MNIVIIEDEDYSAEDLAQTILKNEPSATITIILKSVKEAVKYLRSKPLPDLFFSDIQLGDGLSFEIFKQITTTVPVIFVTAFDDYAINAFKANGIDYILKPFDSEMIAAALKKYISIYKNKPDDGRIEKLMQWMDVGKEKSRSSILVYQKDKIIPLRPADIALLYVDNDTIKVQCFNKLFYTANATLDELEKQLGPVFYRANRQFLVNRNAVKDVSQHFARKLSVNLTIEFGEPILVSKEKSTAFIEWLSLM
ncbi:MAG: hypothetical protein JWP12_2018 [Bacteroidetes bacterium]|nr:hypothetical protein [Bacteroidota bacterium]